MDVTREPETTGKPGTLPGFLPNFGNVRAWRAKVGRVPGFEGRSGRPGDSSAPANDRARDLPAFGVLVRDRRREVGGHHRPPHEVLGDLLRT